MNGNTDLAKVLRSISVDTDSIAYGFASLESDSVLLTNEILCMYRENEGLTVVADTNYLRDNLIDFEGPFAKLTIEVHTSLELVGLTAALAKALTESGISANVIAAYYHDHIFVPFDKQNEAIEALMNLRRETGTSS